MWLRSHYHGSYVYSQVELQQTYDSRAVKRNNCSFCDKSTIFTRSLPFNMTIYITYGGISEINPHCRKFKISQVSL